LTSERIGIGVLVAAALIVRIAFALAIPAFQAPDEQAHLRYVEYLREHRALPVQPQRSIDMFADPMHQAYQPPLAYLLFVPVNQWLAASEARPPARLRAARIQNACYGAAAVLVGVLVAARLTLRGDPRRFLVAAVLAFFPGFVGIGSAVNNDALANLLAALLWLTLIPGEGRTRSAWRAGAVLGAACLAKLSSLALAPLLLAVPLLQHRRDLRGALRFALAASAVAVLVLLPWMLRNVSVYGNPLAIGAGSLSFEWLATVLPAEQLAAAARPRLDNVFFQFWGRFGIANNLSWSGIPLLMVTLSLLALAAWIRARNSRPADRFERWAPTFAFAVVLVLAGLVYFSLGYAGAWQGRYLYGAMVPVALLLAGGWGRWLPGRSWWLPVAAIALALLALDVVALLELRHFFATQPPGSWILFTRL
jgi:hypothetical protein